MSRIEIAYLNALARLREAERYLRSLNPRKQKPEKMLHARNDVAAWQHVVRSMQERYGFVAQEDAA